MKQKKFFLNPAALAVAAVIGICLASCKDSDKPYTVTDIDDEEWYVTSAGGFRFTYDEDGHLTSIIDRNGAYIVKDDEDKLVLDWNDFDETSHTEIVLNDDYNITKIVYSWTEDEDDTGSETYNFSYDSNKRLVSCSCSGRGNGGNNRTKSWTHTSSYGWSSNQMTIHKEENRQTYNNGETRTNSNRYSYVFTCIGQSNRCKQLPYYMGNEMIDFEELSGMFTVLGLFGSGPENLPTDYTYTYESGYNVNETVKSKHTLDFTQNSNGTINSERRGYSYGNGNYSYDTFNYMYAASRADAPATQNFKEFVHNSLRKASLKHRGQ